MRLINTATLLLHDFPLGEVPPYAILSHTWGDGEVSFQDMSSLDRLLKRGYEKITRTCGTIREHHNTPPHATQHSGMPTGTARHRGS
jgi:hypothetical protein